MQSDQKESFISIDDDDDNHVQDVQVDNRDIDEDDIVLEQFMSLSLKVNHWKFETSNL